MIVVGKDAGPEKFGTIGPSTESIRQATVILPTPSDRTSVTVAVVWNGVVSVGL